jgi:uncharacterized membrane protein
VLSRGEVADAIETLPGNVAIEAPELSLGIAYLFAVATFSPPELSDAMDFIAIKAGGKLGILRLLAMK